MLEFFQILWACLVIFSATVTLFSLLPGKQWWMRVCDFPRIQILSLGIILLCYDLCLLAILDEHVQPETEVAHGAMFFILIASIICQSWWAYRLTPIAKPELAGATRNQAASQQSTHGHIRIIAANIDYTNEQRDRAIRQVLEHNPDVIALIETDDHWTQQIEHALKQLPHSVTEFCAQGCGMALLSRFPIIEQDIKYLVDKDRPSIWATIELPNSDQVHLVVTHPPPPGLPKRRKDERHSSKPRDIELDIIAKTISERPNAHWVLTGDFNDVGWSATTLRAKRVSGLLDPRVGRGLFNTFPAGYPFLRYPIDHVLVSPSFRLGSLARLKPNGSDHLPLLVDLVIAAGK